MSSENSTSPDAFADLFQLRPLTVFCMTFSAFTIPLIITMLYSGNKTFKCKLITLLSLKFQNSS